MKKEPQTLDNTRNLAVQGKMDWFKVKQNLKGKGERIMKKGKVGCLVIVLIFIGGLIFGITQIVKDPEKYQKSEKSVDVIFDASSVSRISVEDLISKMGEPIEKEDWINKTTKGNFDVSTYTYDKEGIHYEFIITENSVIRLNVYSNLNWNKAGDNFKYKQKNKEDILSLFGIVPNENAKKSADNGSTFRISPVSNTVADFNVQGINETDKTFEFVKITYNIKYFD